MAHDEHRARPGVEQVLHHGEHVGVEVVAGLVEHEHVGFVEKHAEQRKAPLLPAREIVHEVGEFPLVKAELFEELRRALRLAIDDIAVPIAAEDLEHAPVSPLGEAVEVLGHPAEADRLADLDRAGRRLELARHEGEERRLARAVGAEDAETVSGTHDPRDVVDDSPRASRVGERDVLHLDDLLAEPAHGKAFELDGVSQRRIVGKERHGGVDAKLRLARTSLRSVGEPVELLPEGILPALLGRGRLPVALDPLLDVG